MSLTYCFTFTLVFWTILITLLLYRQFLQNIKVLQTLQMLLYYLLCCASAARFAARSCWNATAWASFFDRPGSNSNMLWKRWARSYCALRYAIICGLLLMIGVAMISNPLRLNIKVVSLQCYPYHTKPHLIRPYRTRPHTTSTNLTKPIVMIVIQY